MNPDQRILRHLSASPNLAPLAMDGSPMAQALNAKLLLVDTKSSSVEVSFFPNSVFTQAAGVVQGGAVAAMLDFVLAYAALASIPDGQSVATATLNVSFLRPAVIGPFKAIGCVERTGRSIVFTSAKLLDQEERCVATANSALPIIQWKQ